MKLTKSKLKQIIQEELEDANWPDANEAKAVELYRKCLKMGPGRKDPDGWHHGGEACIDNLLSLGEISEEEINKLGSYILNLAGRWQNSSDPANPTGKGRYLIVKKSDLPTTQREGKLTISKLKQIIQEELQKVLKEEENPPSARTAAEQARDLKAAKNNSRSTSKNYKRISGKLVQRRPRRWYPTPADQKRAAAETARWYDLNVKAQHMVPEE